MVLKVTGASIAMGHGGTRPPIFGPGDTITSNSDLISWYFISTKQNAYFT